MIKTIFYALMLIAISLLPGCESKITTDIRASFVAIYSVTETWTENGKPMSKPEFTMSVVISSQKSDMLLLNNFANYGAGVTAEATVSGSYLTIPQQTLSNLKAIIGTGKLNDPTLTLSYTESYNGSTVDITATAIKQ